MSLPIEVKTDTITIYNYYKDNLNKEFYVKTILTGVYLIKGSSEMSKQTGKEEKRELIIMQDYDSNYVNKDVWLTLDDRENKYTYDNSISGRNTLVVIGECDFDFSEDMDAETISKEIGEFDLAVPNHYTVKNVKENFKGSVDMWHLKVIC